MRLPLVSRFISRARWSGISLGAALLLGTSAVSATPVLYTFTAGGAGNVYASSSVGVPVVSTIGNNAVISGSFLYDAASPLTGFGAGGVSIYGNAAGAPAAFKSLTGSVSGFSFSDPFGFATVGNNTAFGDLSNTDSIEFYADSPLTSSAVHNFSGPTIAGYRVVSLRMFWFQGLPSIGDFLADQSLPGAPPTLTGRLALDLGTSADPTLLATSFVFFNNLVVQAAPVAEVPEPGTAMLVLAAAMLGVATRRRRGASSVS